jgi:hypothetical protein
MNRPFRFTTPDRLQIREGGGCMSVFGLPFFGAGVFLFLTMIGAVPVSNADEMPMWAWPFMVLMAVAFTAVGGGLAFGRSWTTIDRAQRQVIKHLGLLMPMHERIVPLDGYTVVTLGFEQGDSDSVDKFPVGLKHPAGSVLALCSFTDYAQARESAKAVAAHLQFEIEDASTDHPVRLTVSEADRSFRQRLRREATPHSEPVRPPGARSRVTRDLGEVTIVIPSRPMHPLTIATTLIPIAIILAIGPPLSTFFKESNTPDPVGWAFLGFLVLFFGVLPVSTIAGSFLRSRRGATIVEISRERLRILERGIWRTRQVASFDEDDILDVDYSSRESSSASARRAAEQQAFAAHPDATQVVSPRVDRIITKLARFAQSKGVTLKTRKGITTFGQGLGDEEIRYLCTVVRRALAW